MPRGSAPGERRGGRQKGTPNKKNQQTQVEIAASGETPLDYMLRVMRDPDADTTRRDDLAKAAANYVHSKLATTQVTGKDGGPLQVEVVRFTDGQGEGS